MPFAVNLMWFYKQSIVFVMTENFTWLLGMPMNKKIMIIVHLKLRQKQNLKKKTCLRAYFFFSLCNRNRRVTSACRLTKKKGHTIATENIHTVLTLILKLFMTYISNFLLKHQGHRCPSKNKWACPLRNGL